MRTITPNLWTVLQLRAYGEASAEGQAATAWVGPDQSPAAMVTFARRWKNRVTHYSARLASMLIGPFNRVADGLGMGDSILVELVRD